MFSISFKLVTSLILATIVVIVGATCLGVTLATAIETITAVGEAWARSITHSVSDVVHEYFANWEEQLVSATAVAQRDNISLPSEDWKLGKRNWTEPWVDYLMRVGAKNRFRFDSVSVRFFDYWWIFISDSRFDPTFSTVNILEWIEAFDGSFANMSVGGFRFSNLNMTRIPYTAASNYTHEVLFAPRPLQSPIDPGLTGYFNALRIQKPKSLTNCFITFPEHNWDPQRQLAWNQFYLCALYGRGGISLGDIVVGLNPNKDLRPILQASPLSAHGQAFIVLANGAFVYIATTPDPTFTTREVPGLTLQSYIAPGCSSSVLNHPYVVPPRLGCFHHIHNYSYAPLRALSVEFATTTGYRFAFVKADDGESYAVAAQRLFMDALAVAPLNVIIVLPEADLFLEQVRNSIALSAGLAVLVAVVAVVAALTVIQFVVKRLEGVHDKMIAVSQLKNLDEDVNVEDMDGEGMLMSGQRENEGEGDGGDADDGGKAIIAAFFNAKNKNVKVKNIDDSDDNKNKNKNDQQGDDRSWIAEVAHLEDAYAETVRSMTNFTRYVSRAVVSELIIQRKLAVEARHRQQQRNGKDDDDDDDVPHKVGDHSLSMTTTTTIHQNNKIKNNKMGNSGKAAAAVVVTTSQIARNEALAAAAEASIATAAEYDVTVLIAEIEGFSTSIWSDNADNHEGVLYILHIYFKRMTRLIMGHGGVVDKFLGDSIMSYWGAPVKTDHHALLATLTALAILRESRRDPLKKIFAQTLKRDVKLRCGVSTGAAIVGTFGNSEFVNYSLVGAPVKQARHLQLFNQYWRTSILMDGNCMRRVGETIVHRLLCSAQFEQDATPDRAYEVIGVNLDSQFAHERIKTARFSFTNIVNIQNNNNINNNNGNGGSGDTSIATMTTTMSMSPPSNNNNNNEINNIRNDKNNDANNRSHDEARSIAFTDVLSLPTLGSNEGVEDLLRSTAAHSVGARRQQQEETQHLDNSVDQLLNWHATRTAVPQFYVTLSEMFSEAARNFIDCKFNESVKELEKVVAAATTFEATLLNSSSTLSKDNGSGTGKQPSQSNKNNNTNTESQGMKNEEEKTTSSSSSGSNNAKNSGTNLASLSRDLAIKTKNKDIAQFLDYLRLITNKSIFTSSDKCLSNLRKICNLYLTSAPPSSNVWESDHTFFIRAYRLADIDASNAQQQTQNGGARGGGGGQNNKSNNTHNNRSSSNNSSRSSSTSNNNNNSSSRSNSSRSGANERRSSNNNNVDPNQEDFGNEKVPKNTNHKNSSSSRHRHASSGNNNNNNNKHRSSSSSSSRHKNQQQPDGAVCINKHDKDQNPPPSAVHESPPQQLQQQKPNCEHPHTPSSSANIHQ